MKGISNAEIGSYSSGNYWFPRMGFSGRAKIEIQMVLVVKIP
jgi:hypothetical protein